MLIIAATCIDYSDMLSSSCFLTSFASLLHLAYIISLSVQHIFAAHDAESWKEQYFISSRFTITVYTTNWGLTQSTLKGNNIFSETMYRSSNFQSYMYKLARSSNSLIFSEQTWMNRVNLG